MRRPQGYATITSPDKPLFERDTVSCGHCGAISLVQPRQDPSELGGFCRGCYRHICGPCTSKLTCEPFEKKLEEMERRGQLFKAMGLE